MGAVVGMGKLTALKVNALIKDGVVGLTCDGGGLYLQISRTGGASWIYRYKISGSKARDMGLGPCSVVTLSEARAAAVEARKLSIAGIDPIEARNKERREALDRAEQESLVQRQLKAQTVPFKQIASDYIEAHRLGWKNAKHAQQWVNTLKTYAYPVIGDLAASEVTTDHVLEVLQPIWNEKPETASRVRNRIELVLDAAKAKSLREGDNPARWRGHLDKLLPKRSKVRAVKSHSAMPWMTLPSFMESLKKVHGLGARALELTILTGCRSNEVLSASWEEFDLENAIWIIPEIRMKARREHKVPLSEAALSLLSNLPKFSGSSWVFSGLKQGKPLSNMAMTAVMRRMEFAHFTVHGFRSTFRDWAAESTHYPREVCELALAHQVAKGAEAAYWRGDLFEKRRALMSDWGDYCNSGSVSSLKVN